MNGELGVPSQFLWTGVRPRWPRGVPLGGKVAVREYLASTSGHLGASLHLCPPDNAAPATSDCLTGGVSRRTLTGNYCFDIL